MKTYFLDTNYILRLLLKDNLSQYNQAINYITKAKKKQISLMTSVQAIFEVHYVLKKFYKIPKLVIVSSLIPFVSSNYLYIDHQITLSKALFLYNQVNHSLVDLYFSVLCQDNNYQFLTFDKKLTLFHKKIH